MKRKIVLILAVSFLAFASLGCDKINELLSPKKAASQKTAPAIIVKGPIVAKINNIPISLEDLTQEVDAYNAIVPADKPELKITTREQKIDYLKNEMVRRTMLYQEALDRGLDRNDEVRKALEKTKMDLLVVELVKEEAGKVEVTSKEIEDYYNKYKEQLKEPEEREIREIMAPTEQEAKDILVQLIQGADFATLAKERSKAPSAKDGWDVVVQRGKKFPQFDSIVFSDALDVGKISSVFKGPDGYYIVKLEAKKGGRQKSLSELYDDIKRGLTFLKQQERINDLIGKLSSQAKLEFYEGEIK